MKNKLIPPKTWVLRFKCFPEKERVREILISSWYEAIYLHCRADLGPACKKWVILPPAVLHLSTHTHTKPGNHHCHIHWKNSSQLLVMDKDYDWAGCKNLSACKAYHLFPFTWDYYLSCANVANLEKLEFFPENGNLTGWIINSAFYALPLVSYWFMMAQTGVLCNTFPFCD